jgi:hypothetical protein
VGEAAGGAAGKGLGAGLDGAGARAGAGQAVTGGEAAAGLVVVGGEVVAVTPAADPGPAAGPEDGFFTWEQAVAESTMSSTPVHR